MLNKTKGNMYSFVTHTWNPIKGRCSHDCSYCYMKAMYKRFKADSEPAPIHLDEKEMKINLGGERFIFVGSSCDMWAETVPNAWINLVLVKCLASSFANKNKYLFQTKNPKRCDKFLNLFPNDSIICTTLESSRNYPEFYGNSPAIMDRVVALERLNSLGFKTMVTIEPVMNFDVDELLRLIKLTGAFQVNIGADSGNNHLPEPPARKIHELISELKKFTKVVQKKNLARLLK